jgi:hypothetical protein
MSPTHRLTPDQQQFYRANGYLLGLPPIYAPAEMARINAELPNLLALLRPGETFGDIREWHHTSTYLYEIVMNPKILDLVESILGPNFYVWGSHFFIKPPHSPGTVPWHQDAYYWPLSPCNTVTVWVAFDDVDEANGGMKLIPGSHLGGLMKHGQTSDANATLSLGLADGSAFSADTAVQFRLKAGEVSLHDDRAIHGSQANPFRPPPRRAHHPLLGHQRETRPHDQPRFRRAPLPWHRHLRSHALRRRTHRPLRAQGLPAQRGTHRRLPAHHHKIKGRGGYP